MKSSLTLTFSLILLFPLFSCKHISQNWKYDTKTNNLTIDKALWGNEVMLYFDDYITSFTAYNHSCSNDFDKLLTDETIDEMADTELHTQIQKYKEFSVKINDKTRETYRTELKDYMRVAREAQKQKPIQNLSLQDDLYNNQSIRVNGKKFEGTIYGYHKTNGQKIFEYHCKEDEKRPVPGANLAFSQSLEARKCTIWTKEGEMQKHALPMFGATRKPIIYLYPTQEQSVNVQLDIQHGKLTSTYPKYPANQGWTVNAKPNGTLIDPSTQKEYYALYWEADSRYRYDMSKGFVVEREKTAEFLDEKLAELGLNRREANEFIIYWLPILEQNPYNLIHFSTDEYVAENRMQISPTPETLIRLLMVYSPLNQPIEIATQQFEPIQRKGFTVVEWGGQEQLLSEY